MLVGSSGPTQTTLSNATFDHNSTSGNGGGIINSGYHHLTLTNVTFTDNTAGASGGGISNSAFAGVASNGTVDLTTATFHNNAATSNGSGIYNEMGNVHIRNSILYDNPDKEISGIADATYSIVQGGYPGTGNLNQDPLLNALANNGGFTQTMALGAGSPAIDAGDDANCPAADQRGVTRPQGSHCDIGAYEYRSSPAIYYVKKDAIGANNGASWDNAFTNLQSAFAVASSGDEIWVAAGTYKPTTGADRTIAFALKNGVAIYGGFAGTETSRTQRDPAANVTILSGDIGIQNNNDDNSYHVVIGSHTDSSAILDGFTITAGNANGNSPDYWGGGMYNDSSSPTLVNMIFTKNSAFYDGGGMFNYQGSNPTLTNVTFLDNQALYGGGMSNYQDSNSTLTDVTFSNNSAQGGGGLRNYGSHPTLTKVIFDGNFAADGGGMYNSNNSNPILTDVVFTNNAAGSYGGGMYNWSSSPSLVNVTFSGNSASNGGGVSDYDNSKPSLVNVTFSNNSASQDGGGMYDTDSSSNLKNVTFSGNMAALLGGGLYSASIWISGSGATPTIFNSIFWADTGGEIVATNVTPIVGYSIVQDGYAGTGNLHVDPLLRTLTNNGGFTQTMALDNHSPALDAGDDSSCPETDQRGVARPQGIHCDIGAYEIEATSVSVSIGKSIQQNYGLVPTSQREVYDGMNTGPVKVENTSKVPMLTSMKVLFSGKSYSEMMGLPVEQLSQEYWFPSYNNITLNSQVRVGNLGNTSTVIKVYLGNIQIDSYTLSAGGATRKVYAYNGGPLRVTSSATKILSTIRLLYNNQSFSELMGLPKEQLTTSYLFPYYNNVAMISNLQVSNVGTTSTTIKVYLGTAQIDSFSLAAKSTTSKIYSGQNSGPLKVTSSAANIVPSLRVLYAGQSYSEMIGYPANKLTTEYWYPTYDNATLNSQLRVSNVGNGSTTIKVYVGNSTTAIDTITLLAGQAARRNYKNVNGGPLHVVSSSQPILSTVRELYQTPGFQSFYEMMGMPKTQLSTQYYFPWYNNVAMNSELRLAVP